MRQIILASSSPRRKALLENLGLEFKVDTSNTPEHVHKDLEPHHLARLHSLEKAQAVAERHRDAIVIAADTLGVLEGQVFGKPTSEDDARRTLKRMSGKCHLVITGFAIIDTKNQKTITRSIETKVWFRELRDEEIRAYVSSGEPMDKAGAYAIQGLGSLLVDRIEGDYYNVIGLPLSAMAESLKDFGVEVLLTAAPRHKKG
jgi:septum formation protein